MSSDLMIVNKEVQGDEMGAYTCHISQGSSLVDCFIVSFSLMAAVSSLTVLDQRLESDHCPLRLMLNLQAEQSRRKFTRSCRIRTSSRCAEDQIQS